MNRSIVLAVSYLSVAAMGINYGHIRLAAPLPSIIKSPLPHEYMDLDRLPASYDIRNIKGKSFTTINQNQLIPRYCGSCWAHAATSSLSDRINLLSGGKSFTELSRQVLIHCVTGPMHSGSPCRGCHGGNQIAAHDYIAKHGVPDETCQAYEAIGNGTQCNAMNICRVCHHTGVCEAIENPPLWYIEEHGQVYGEKQMMAEIVARGPIGCTIAWPKAADDYTGGVFNDTAGARGFDHDIEVAGYGTTDKGIPYWLIRNSLGVYWGEEGWFRMVRGADSLGIESQECSWAVPRLRNTSHTGSRYEI